MPRNAAPVTPEAAYSRAAARCARSEQCRADWQKRFATMGLSRADADAVISRLEREGFIDEARYARAFAHDKAHYDRWGSLKIRSALAAKGIAKDDIAEAIAQIPEDLWRDNLGALLTSKLRTIGDTPAPERRARLLRFAASRGYEPALIYSAVSRFGIPEED